MRFSFWTGNSHPWAEILETCQYAESTGWDGIWLADHFLPFAGEPTEPYHEAWGTIGGLAALVPRVRIGTMVTGNTYRYPAVLAKMVASIDHVSGGRIVLGLGSGWMESEHRAYGIPFGTAGQRLDMLEEACEVIKSLYTREISNFSGRYYNLVDAPLEPKPLQDPLPLLIGGGGEKRTLAIAARWADEWNVWGTPEVLAHKGSVLEGHCERVGRDPAEISRSAVALLFLSTDESWLARIRENPIDRPTIIGTPEQVTEIIAAYREVGVDEIVIPDFNLGPAARRRETMDLFIEQVAPAFR